MTNIYRHSDLPRHPASILRLLLEAEGVPVHLVQDARLPGQLESLSGPARGKSFEGVRGVRPGGQRADSTP